MSSGLHLSRGTFPSALRLAKAYTSPAVAISLRVLPRLAKLVAYIIIILNARSLPFAWHSMLPRYSILSLPKHLFSLRPSPLILARY